MELSLRDGAAASLELIDVAGRRVETRDLGALGAGPHTVALGHAGLTPGLYLLRLQQGGDRAVRRVVVTR